MRIRPNAGKVIWVGCVMAVLPFCVLGLYHAHFFVTSWSIDQIYGVFIVEFFAIPMLIYGILNVCSFLEFDKQYIRHRGYFRTLQIPIAPSIVASEYVIHAPQGAVFELWFSRVSGGEYLLKINSYLDLFAKQDLQKFMRALVLQCPQASLDPSLLRRLQQS